MAIKIITDSTSYIEKEIRESLQIEVLSLIISFSDESIKEMEIDNDNFYKKMEIKGIPMSSQPSIGYIYEKMKNIIENGDDIIGIFLSSKMSGTYNSLQLVRKELIKEYPNSKIHIIDSLSNSMQLGFAVIAAAKSSLEGKDFNEIIKITENNIKRSRFLFIPDTLDYLKKGGRIGGANALIGNILKIIPILTVKNGTTAVYKIVRTKVKAIKTMIEKLLIDDNNYKVKEIVVHHINCYSQAEKLKNKLKEKLNIPISIVDIGPVIGMHVGPGSIGIAYYTEDEIIE